MNRIRIFERDSTTTGLQDATIYDIAYVPGFVQELDSNENLAPPYSPRLCTTIKEFETYFGTHVPIFDTDQPYPRQSDSDGFTDDAIPSYNMFNANDPDPSYIYAKELIRAGIPVVYERMNVYMTPGQVPIGDEYDLTVKHMYDRLMTTFATSHTASGSTDVENCNVTVNGEMFSDEYNAAQGTYVFKYVSNERAAIDSAICSNTSVELTIDDNVFLNKYTLPNTYVFTQLADVVGQYFISSGNYGSIEIDDSTFLTINPVSGSYTYNYVSNLSAAATTTITSGEIEVDADAFTSSYIYISSESTYVFTYESSDSTWYYDSSIDVDLSELGISITSGTPADGNTITVTISTDNVWVNNATSEEVDLQDLGITITQEPQSGSQIIVTVNAFWTDGSQTSTGNLVHINLNTIGITLTGQTELNDTITIVTSIQNVIEWYCEKDKKYVSNLASIGITLSAPENVQLGNVVTILSYVIEPLLLDRGEYSVKYLTSGGYPTFEYNTKAISQQMATLCKARGDCIALIDHTNNMSRSLIGKTSVYEVAKSQAYALDDGTDVFAAMFTPWGSYGLVSNYSASNQLTDTSINIASCDLPPSFAYLITLASSIQINPNWLAIAGATRGKVKNLLEVNSSQILTNSIADSYQNDDVVCINPITNIKPYGQCIWGNRTLALNKTGATALSYLNLRNLVNDIKKNLYKSCQGLLFEQNTDILWVKFLSKVTPQLDQMVSGSGISGYKVIKGNPSDKTLITATVIIYPVYAVEQFEITVHLTDDELSVTES